MNQSGNSSKGPGLASILGNVTAALKQTENGKNTASYITGLTFGEKGSKTQ